MFVIMDRNMDFYVLLWRKNTFDQNPDLIADVISTLLRHMPETN